MKKAVVPSSAYAGQATVNPVRGQMRVQRLLPTSTQASRGHRTQQVQCDTSARGPTERALREFFPLPVCVYTMGLHPWVYTICGPSPPPRATCCIPGRRWK